MGKPMTADEDRFWRYKMWDKFGPIRLIELRQQKKMKQRKLMGMISSPTPHIVAAAGAIMTALDDAQDALATLSVIGRTAGHFLPKTVAKIFTGPAGWLLTAADIINAVQCIGRNFSTPMSGKRIKDSVTKNNPLNKKAKVRRARRMRRLAPTLGEAIEGLQTSQAVFGFGVSLGPIVGLVQDLFYGAIAKAAGMPVGFNPGVPEFPPWTAAAQKMCKAMTIYTGAGHVSDDEELLSMALAYQLSQQELLVGQADWNPLDHLLDVHDTIFQAPIPTDPITLEVIAEAGIPLSECCNWPHSGEPWATTQELLDNYDAPAQAFVYDNIEKHQHDWIGATFGQICTDAAITAMAVIEGEDNVIYDYSVPSKVASSLLNAGTILDPRTTPYKAGLFISWIEALDVHNDPPAYKDIVLFCENNKIQLIPMFGDF